MYKMTQISNLHFIRTLLLYVNCTASQDYQNCFRFADLSGTICLSSDTHKPANSCEIRLSGPPKMPFVSPEQDTILFPPSGL